MIHNYLFVYLLSISSCFVGGLVAREVIIGGTKAACGQFPYQVILRNRTDKSYCGGGILNDHFILTAAHCVIVDQHTLYSGMPITVLAGSHDINITERPAVIANVQRIFVLKEYKPPNANATGDIAVLMLKGPLGLKHHENIMKPLELPHEHENYKTAIIAGIGWDWIKIKNHQHMGGRRSTYLLFAEVDVLSQCSQQYHKLAVPEKHICAKIKQPFFGRSRGVCKGDSGGPLAHNGIAIGVLSRGPVTCTERENGATYTRVAFYLNFIENSMRNQKTDDINTFDFEIL